MNARATPTAPLPTWAWIAAILSLLASYPLGQHYLQVGMNATARPESSDFYKFYLSAERFRQGQGMYWMVPPRTQQGDACHPDTPAEEAARVMPRPGPMVLGGHIPCLAPNLNPPIFMAVLLPLSHLPYAQAWWTWAALSAACAIWGVWVLVAGVTGQGRVQQLLWTGVASVALFAYYPTLANFSMGQVGTTVLLLLALCWRDLRDTRNWRAGVWLGLGIAFKPFVAAMLLMLLAIGRWRAVKSALLVATGLTLLGIAAFGMQPYQDYVQIAGNVNWTASNWNGSWFGFFDRYFSGQADSSWPSTRPLSKAIATGFALGSLLIAIQVSRTACRRSARDGVDAALALGVPATLLASPLGWVYYFPALAISLALTWAQTLKEHHKREWRWMLFLCILLTTIPISLHAIPTPHSPTVWYGMDAWHTYCLNGALFTSLLIFGSNENGRRSAHCE